MAEINDEIYKVDQPQVSESAAPPSLQARREALGVKQAVLAALADTNACALSYIERGIPNVCYSEATKQRVAEALEHLERQAANTAERRREFWDDWIKKTRPIVRREVTAIVGEARP